MIEGWALELPTVQEAQELAEAGEREAERRTRALQDEQRERMAERADAAATQAWLDTLRGRERPDVDGMLARGRQDTGLPGDADRERRQRARDILRQYGLEDVLGGWSGVVLDANMGVLEAPGRGEAQRSADIEDAELARYLERNDADRRYIENIRRSRLPFALRKPESKSEVGRSVAATEPVPCPACLDMGATPEEAIKIHLDPGYRVPAGADAPDPAANGQVERLVALGYSRKTAEYAATPAGRVITR